MHMAMVISGGVVLLGLFLDFSKLWAGVDPDLAIAAKLFIPAWLIVSLVNIWVGVTEAGYSICDELPVLLAVFLLPALFAGLGAWRLER